MNRRAILVALAVVLALVGTVGVYGYLHGADRRAASSERAVSVVVADKRVAVGTSWKDAVASGALSVQHMPASATPAQALTGLSAGIAQDAVAQADIAPGTPVLRQVFGPVTAQTGVLAIPKGLLALSVSLSADADVAGYVAPQSQVAIFVTAPFKPKNASSVTNTSGTDLTVTRLVVARASVIATSQSAPSAVVASTSSSSAASTGAAVIVTLALSQADAERVINQQKIGEITLGLLSSDSVVTQDGGYVNTGVFSPEPIWAH